jgi:hypothetical protein
MKKAESYVDMKKRKMAGAPARKEKMDKIAKEVSKKGLLTKKKG